MEKNSFVYVSDEIVEKFRAKKGDKYTWKNEPPQSTDDDTVQGYSHSVNYLYFPSYGQFIFQCKKCKAHFFLKECPNCQSKSFLYGRVGANKFNCCDCLKEFSSWTCPKCDNQNLNQSSLFFLKKEGCFIATSVYGSYHAPEVILLRNFRDNVLFNTRIGTFFIKVYYCLSPVFADYVSDKKALKYFIRVGIFKPIVKVLNSILNFKI